MKRPDVLMVVLDCVRRDVSDPDGSVAAHTPVLDGLRRDGTSFERAVATSHWTIPAHASLLTGTYPWEHRVFRGSTLSLPATTVTIAEEFRRAGYRTGLFSSNPFLSPLTGLQRGFEVGAWGQFSDCFRRYQVSPRPAGRFGERLSPEGAAEWQDAGEPAYVRDTLRRLTTRFPLAAEILFEGARLRHGASWAPHAPRVGGWIEPELRAWLARVPSDEPVFCCINLLDAHEPYFGVMPFARGRVREWLAAYSGPLDRTSWRRGDARPTAADLRRIRSLYRASIELIDHRLGGILEIVRGRAGGGRLATAVVADHGQALGEEGLVYHVRGAATSLLRVPMILNDSTRTGPARIDAWTSIKDTLPLMTEIDRDVGLAVPELAGRSPRESAEMGSTGQVAALVDGPPADALPSGTTARTPQSDEHWVAVYGGDIKVQVNVGSGVAYLYPDVAGPNGHGRTPLPPDVAASPVARSALAIRDTVRDILSRGAWGLTGDRLRSWGY